MSTEPLAGVPRSGTIDWRRPEFVLTGLAFLGFATLLIRIRTISADLPAHPLFVHVPVVLIPLSVIGGLVMVTRPRLMDRYGPLLCVGAIVAMSSIFLAMRAGAALESSLALSPQAAHLISEHSAAADVLAFVFVGFTALLILLYSAQHIRSAGPTGLRFVDQILGQEITLTVLRLLVALLALVAAFYVYRVGDLGARAVWLGRLH